MSRYLKIIRKNGDEHIVGEETGFKIRDFVVESPVPRYEQESLYGLDGYLDTGAEYEPRRLSALLQFYSYDKLDYPLKRNEIFRIFASKEQFYLIDSYEAGKRWLVRADGFRPEQLTGTAGEFDITFQSSSAYAESLGTTLDPLTFDVELWQIGQGLTLDSSSYIKNTNTFTINNIGDRTINPRFLPLVIKFEGASTNLQIKNLTTLDFWKYTGTTTSGQSIILDGVKMWKQGVSIVRDTNKKIITLAPGINEFEIIGASSFVITFEHRFYYI